MKKRAFIFLLSILPSLALATAAADFVLVNRIAENRDSLSLEMANPYDRDYFCDEIKIKVQISHDEFNDKVADIDYRFSNIYIPEKGRYHIDGILKDEVDKLKTEGEVAIIHSASSKVGTCRPATFVEYCEFADRGPEEKTLTAIKNEMRRDRCVDIVERAEGELDLQGRGLENLKPLSFMNLTELNLRDNYIVDVSPLRFQDKLRFVDVSKNPLQNIDVLVALPVIETVKANDTSLAAQQFPVLSRSLRKLCVDDTPFQAAFRRTPYYKQLPMGFCF